MEGRVQAVISPVCLAFSKNVLDRRNLKVGSLPCFIDEQILMVFTMDNAAFVDEVVLVKGDGIMAIVKRAKNRANTPPPP